MDKVIGTIVIALIIALIAVLMIRSWRARGRRDAGLSAYPAPASAGAPGLLAEVLYVATTPHETPLERLAVRGLAFRAQATLAVAADGVRIGIPGEEETFLPAAALRGVATASWAIDRGVETQGLIRLSWLPLSEAADPVVVDSYFRARRPGDSARIIAEIQNISTVSGGTTSESEA